YDDTPVSYNNVNTMITLHIQEKSLIDMWSLEAIGIKDPAEQVTKEEHDQQVKETFQKSIVRDSGGRYVVQLPWVCDPKLLPSNRGVAEKRLQNATRKLIIHGQFDKYDDIIKQWTEEEFVEKCPVKPSPIPGEHYLPH